MIELHWAFAGERRSTWKMIRVVVSSVGLFVTTSVFAAELPVAQCASEINLDEAIEACSTVIASARDRNILALARYNRAEWYVRGARAEQAISDLTEAIRLDPGFAGAYAKRGIALELISEVQRARADFNAVLKLPMNTALSRWAHTTAREHLAEIAKTFSPRITSAPADNSKLSGALEECNTGPSEAIKLPGAKGEIPLNRCYRGRAHFSCTAAALLKEANSIKQDYAEIAAADYPNLKSIDEICKLPPDRLADHLQAVQTSSDRWNALRKEYGAQVECANSIEDSLRNLSLADMTYASDIMKSMIEAVRGELTPLSTAETDVLNLADRLVAAQRALVTIQKIRNGICR
jgi:tetratricopeptide (TPR) repeat protein